MTGWKFEKWRSKAILLQVVLRTGEKKNDQDKTDIYLNNPFLNFTPIKLSLSQCLPWIQSSWKLSPNLDWRVFFWYPIFCVELLWDQIR